MSDTIDPSQKLALERTSLAYERTYAAWVRTGLGFLVSGLGIRSLLERHMPDVLLRLAGSTLILFSCFCFIAAYTTGHRIKRVLGPSAAVPPCLFKCTTATLALGSAIALAAIWFV